MKKFKDGFYGILIMAGFILIGSDTDTAGQLLSAILLGFALLLLGGRGLIINNRKDKDSC
jgi:hypothetical protein